MENTPIVLDTDVLSWGILALVAIILIWGGIENALRKRG